MKIPLLISSCCLILIQSIVAQGNYQKTIPTNGATTFSIESKYADLVIQTWDKAEILIQGQININDSLDNDKFVLESEINDGILQITSNIKMEELSKKTTNWYRNHSNQDNCCNCCEGNNIEAVLTINVPKNRVLSVVSKFGDMDLEGITTGVELQNTHGSIDVKFSKLSNTEKLFIKSKHNHVDISLPRSTAAVLTLKSSYGEIFTDMDLTIKGGMKYPKSTIEAYLNGGGTPLYAESTHSNIYLRYL